MKFNTIYHYGKRGNMGEKGIKGDKGILGVSGNPGYFGIIGKKGDKGNCGKIGRKGEEGNEGEQGLSSFDNIQLKGLNGCKGNDGIIFQNLTYYPDFIDINYNNYTFKLDKKIIPGIKGAKGFKGYQGEKGNKNISNFKGIIGDKGNYILDLKTYKNRNFLLLKQISLFEKIRFCLKIDDKFSKFKKNIKYGFNVTDCTSVNFYASSLIKEEYYLCLFRNLSQYIDKRVYINYLSDDANIKLSDYLDIYNSLDKIYDKENKYVNNFSLFENNPYMIKENNNILYPYGRYKSIKYPIYNLNLMGLNINISTNLPKCDNGVDVKDNKYFVTNKAIPSDDKKIYGYFYILSEKYYIPVKIFLRLEIHNSNYANSENILSNDFIYNNFSSSTTLVKYSDWLSIDKNGYYSIENLYWNICGKEDDSRFISIRYNFSLPYNIKIGNVLKDRCFDLSDKLDNILSIGNIDKKYNNKKELDNFMDIQDNYINKIYLPQCLSSIIPISNLSIDIKYN